MTHPVTGESILAFAEVSTICDGAGRLRTELRHLTTVGPPENATSVAIWTRESWITAQSATSSLAERHAIEELSFDEMLRLKKDGMTPYIETRAMEGTYLDAALFVLTILRECGDADLLVEEAGIATIESQRYGLDAGIDVATGELVSFGIGHSWGESRVWYVGRMAEPLLPARHPIERRTRVTNGEPRHPTTRLPESPDAVTLVYQSAEPISKIDEDAFRWQSFAGTILDHSDGKVHGPDGGVDPKATDEVHRVTEAIKQAPPPIVTQDAEGRSVPNKVGWLTASRLGLSVSLGMVVLAVGIWVRRRAA
jgi:hypothetical protein